MASAAGVPLSEPTPASSGPAPFLARLKVPRAAPAAGEAAVPVESAGVAGERAGAAASSEDFDVGGDLPFSGESFESATTVVPRSALLHRDVEGGDDGPAADIKPPPPLEELVAKIPAETRDALEQLFRAHFRAVRRIPPEQLR